MRLRWKHVEAGYAFVAAEGEGRAVAAVGRVAAGNVRTGDEVCPARYCAWNMVSIDIL